MTESRWCYFLVKTLRLKETVVVPDHRDSGASLPFPLLAANPEISGSLLAGVILVGRLAAMIHSDAGHVVCSAAPSLHSGIS